MPETCRGGDVDCRKIQPVIKQPKLDMCLPLSQDRLDSYVLDYIVDSVLPLHHVSTAPLTTFVRQLTGGRFAPRCRQTAAKQLESKYKQRKQELINVLKSIDRVCTTADCWSSRRRSFIGVTIHWIDKDPPAKVCMSCGPASLWSPHL